MSTTLVRESEVEAYLVRRVRKAGGVAFKWVSPGRVGVPDRICLLPGARIAFCEVKAPGKKPTAVQAVVLGILRRLGFYSGYVDSAEAVDRFMERFE